MYRSFRTHGAVIRCIEFELLGRIVQPSLHVAKSLNGVGAMAHHSKYQVFRGNVVVWIIPDGD